mmetsp:Transcript_16573/g.57829  ORF Transcript_16573/g.57829 Transcript_16573/m.57829 type:complete len:224 (-) Transcript_16573:686-1357(-)
MIEVRRRRRLCSLARAVHEHVGVRLRGVLVRGGGAVFVVGVDFVLQILIGATFLKVAQLRLGKALAAVGASPRGKPGRGAVPLHKEPIPVAHDELVDAVAVLAGEAPPEPRPREGRALPRLGARGDRDALAAVRAGGSRALCGRSAVVRGGGGGGGRGRRRGAADAGRGPAAGAGGAVVGQVPVLPDADARHHHRARQGHNCRNGGDCDRGQVARRARRDWRV